jgi:hypothetical protein
MKTNMLRVEFYISLLIIVFTSCSIKIDEKIDKIIELQGKQIGFVTNEQSSLMRELVEYILKTNYKNRYSTYSIPFTLDSVVFNSKMYYYKTITLHLEKKLFFWCHKKDNNEWVINSMIQDSLKNTGTDYELKILLDNNNVVLKFTSNEASFLFNTSNKKVHRIENKFQDLSVYDLVYHNVCIKRGNVIWSSYTQQNISKNAELDSLLILVRNPELSSQERHEIIQKMNAKSEESRQTQNLKNEVYITKVQSKELNNDGRLDYYWVALNKGNIVYYEVYNLNDNTWQNISDTFDIVQFRRDSTLNEILESTRN